MRLLTLAFNTLAITHRDLARSSKVITHPLGLASDLPWSSLTYECFFLREHCQFTRVETLALTKTTTPSKMWVYSAILSMLLIIQYDTMH